MRDNKGRNAKIREAKKLYGSACVNCGSMEDVEYHHVVPLCIGGNDVATNMIPLCRICHRAVTEHEQRLIIMGRNFKGYGSGRKVSKLPDGYEQVFEDYIHCRISSLEAAKKLGKKSRHWRELRLFTDYLKDHNIVECKNNVGIVETREHEADRIGAEAGYVIYTDGRKETFYYKSDVEIPRHKVVEKTGKKKKIKIKPKKPPFLKPNPNNEGATWWYNYKVDNYTENIVNQ